MTLDLAKIKSDAEIIASRCDTLLMPLPVKDVQGMLAEIECFDEGMRNIASFLGAGGYNDPNLSAAALVEKVSWGVGYVCDIHESQLNNLKAENDALRKDDENWQTVQRAMEQLKSDEQAAAIWSACSRILISLASDLNSARSVVTEQGVTKDGAEIGDWRVIVERLAMDKEGS